MTNFLLGGLLVFAMAVALEGYLLFGRAQLLLNHAENLQRMAAKDRRPAGSRAVEPEPDEPADDEPVAEWQPDPDPATDPVGMPPIRRPQPGPAMVPAAAVIDAEWAARRQQIDAEWQAASARIEAGTS